MTTVVRHRHRHHHHHHHYRQFWCAALAAVAATAVVRLPASAASVTGNGLWDDLLGKCDGPRNTMDCVRSRLYGYVETAFEADFNVTDGLRFTRNGNDYETVCRAGTAGAYRQARAGNGTVDHDLKNNHNRDNDHEQDHENDHEQYHENDHEHDQDIDDGWTDVTDRLYDKGAKYLVTHDFEATVPSFLGGGPGAKVRLSPKRILPDGGVIIRMDVLPDDRQARSPRFFHKMIKQLFKKKLMSSAMALMLIIKLIKIKVMFLLPLLIGASAAKKIFLKVLLFLFPPLAHLFKLCTYYHHHASKFHHFHHHKIKHHHHHVKIPVPVPVPAKPPPGYHSEYYVGPTLDHPPGPYDSPDTLSGDYYNRNSVDMNNVVSDHADELASWGLGDYGEGTAQYDGPKYTHSSSPAQYEPIIKYGSGPPPPLPPPPPSSPYAEKYVKRVDDNHVGNRPPLQQATHDPVFTPIVQKLDEIFHELVVPDEPCREKLVCRMYGDPSKFSPHSNLVSAQLSSETSGSSGVRTGVSADAARLWRYVQAAKEGQNGGNCRLLYPACGMLGL